MKKLIVSGCSYTAKEFLSSAYPDLDTSWPKWPELLGKKLNMKVSVRSERKKVRARSKNEIVRVRKLK